MSDISLQTTTNAGRDSLTKSLWQEDALADVKGGQPSAASIYDVLVIGAGITGVTAALMLQKQGKTVVVAEARHVGNGTTGGTSAHLNTFFDATYPEIEKDFGEDEAKLVARGGKEAFDIIAGFVKEYNIDCDLEYKDAYLFSENDDESKQLDEILESSKKAGVDVVSTIKNGVVIPFQKAIVFKNQGQFHPLKYINSLAKEFVKAGGILLEQTFIRETTFENDVHTAKGDQIQIKARNIIYATHIPPGVNLLDFKCAPYRSYVLGIRLEDENYPESLAYDMKEPYHYFRTHRINGNDYLLVGGEDHKTGHDDPEAAFRNLEAYVAKYYNIASVPYKWSSQYYIPADGLPYIGQLPGGDNRIYMATGYNGNGMMFGTLAAKILTDIIIGKDTVYAGLFSPSRVKPIAGFVDFIKENADVAYHFVADRIFGQDIASLNEIPADSGKIVEYHDQKLAIYKDAAGKVHALNPVCTHAKCIVNFNAAEKSWDCPCHGGRFNINGQVLTGPPRMDLQKVEIS